MLIYTDQKFNFRIHYFCLFLLQRMDDTPLEAGLMFTCKLKTETEFQGRSALEEQKNLGGPFKKKVCFTLDNDRYAEIEFIRKNNILLLRRKVSSATVFISILFA